MNKDEFEGKWTQVRGQVHEWWGELGDDDLTRVDGRYEALIGMVQQPLRVDRTDRFCRGSA